MLKDASCCCCCCCCSYNTNDSLSFLIMIFLLKCFALSFLCLQKDNCRRKNGQNYCRILSLFHFPVIHVIYIIFDKFSQIYIHTHILFLLTLQAESAGVSWCPEWFRASCTRQVQLHTNAKQGEVKCCLSHQLFSV